MTRIKRDDLWKDADGRWWYGKQQATSIKEHRDAEGRVWLVDLSQGANGETAPSWGRVMGRKKE